MCHVVLEDLFLYFFDFDPQLHKLDLCLVFFESTGGGVGLVAGGASLTKDGSF